MDFGLLNKYKQILSLILRLGFRSAKTTKQQFNTILTLLKPNNS
jgi:hypothetical protein